MKIEITENIIKAANLLKDKSTHLACFNPVSLALNKSTCYSGWFTTSDTAFSLSIEKESYVLPRKVINFIDDWQSGKKVKPFSFNLKIANIV